VPRIEPFENHFLEYENWFEKNKFVYKSELSAVRFLLPKSEEGLEIGVGSGRFAAPLGIKLGVEPSQKMARIAIKNGIKVIKGVAEELPFYDEQFDFALMVTTICFVDDVRKAFEEAYRILKQHGVIIVGFVDKESIVGREYEAHKSESIFYKTATFYSTNRVVSILKEVGFKNFHFVQTVFHSLNEVKDVEEIRNGYGKGSFVVIRAKK